jgi:dihydrofolate reductase
VSQQRTSLHPRSRLSLIAAMARNRVIGANNAIPWHLPNELKSFKAITMGHHIVMGRNTWESIGRLLPGRVTVIVTRQPDYQVDGAIVVHTLDEALAACGSDSEVFVIGGAQIYTEALPRADRIYLTEIEADIDGDTLMPELDLTAWRAVSRKVHDADEQNRYRYTVTIYERL